MHTFYVHGHHSVWKLETLYCVVSDNKSWDTNIYNKPISPPPIKDKNGIYPFPLDPMRCWHLPPPLFSHNPFSSFSIFRFCPWFRRTVDGTPSPILTPLPLDYLFFLFFFILFCSFLFCQLKPLLFFSRSFTLNIFFPLSPWPFPLL